jgi:hypothetical protein
MALKMTTDMKGDLAPRSVEVREKIIEESTRLSESYQNLAQLLYEVYDNGYFIRYGCETFKEYCEKDGLHYRRSKYLVAIALMVKEMGIKWEDIDGIGWTKMRLLVPILKEQEKVGDWLELAKMHSVKELEALVKESKISSVGISGGDRVVRLNLVLTPEQSQIIFDALDFAKKIIDSDDPGLALEQMSFDYVMSQDAAPDKTSLERLVEYGEKHFGVTMQVADREDVAEMVEQEVKA